MSNKKLDEITKKKFSHLSNQQLVKRINIKFKNQQNDDDEVYELFRRQKEQGFKVIVGFDTYQIEEKGRINND